MSKPDRWLVLTVEVEAGEARELAAAELIALGGSSVMEAAGSLVTYLPAPPERAAPAVADAACERLTAALPAGAAFRVSWEWQADEDWALEWKRGLQPRRVTDRIVVKPTWTAWARGPGEVVVEIDPEMAFGTGEHATTRGCLRLLDGSLRPGDRVLDVGSGSAILSIAAALLGADEVVAVEYDADANLNARDNLVRNGVEGRVTIVEAMADEALLDGLGRFDLIAANILSGVIRPLLPAFRRALAGSPDGRLIVSGILQTESHDVLADATAAGFALAAEDREEEWWSALLTPRGE